MSEVAPLAIVPVSIRVERPLAHHPAEVFAAYADIDRRLLWHIAPDDFVTIEASAFEVGGTDHVLRAGTNSTVRYEQIVESQRIVLTERRFDVGGQLLAIAVATWTIAPRAVDTLVTVTDQTTSLAGSRPIEGLKHRYEQILGRLEQHLAERAS